MDAVNIKQVFEGLSTGEATVFVQWLFKNYLTLDVAVEDFSSGYGEGGGTLIAEVKLRDKVLVHQESEFTVGLPFYD